MNLQETIAAAKAGDTGALEELSLTALGETGDGLLARAAIFEIDSMPWPPASANPQAPKSMVWPKAVEEGTRGPRLGDVAIHNDV